MFYANNEQVKGIFLNGRNLNYLAYGFGKIIPEDRNSKQLNLNLAYKYLNRYRVEYGTVKDGYENALVCPRIDKPDSNGIFHTPFTYYYDGSIVPTKEVDVLINNAHQAFLNASVYSDINIDGNIAYFATNTDFFGHSVNVFPEGENEARLSQHILSNCTNFSFDIQTRFGKQDGYPSVNNCNKFSGNFRYVGSAGNKYPGFRGFLYECKDGVFNIDCTNMHGGGSGANVTNYYNFSGIQSCSNIKLNITGSSWQVWPHDHSFSNNCNINTHNVISGFSYMDDCNFNVVLPKDSKPEMASGGFEFLNNANNCNYNLYATDVNLYNYRAGVGHNAFFDNLNNCNLNLLVNNTTSFDCSFGSNLNHCNIVFDNIKANMETFDGWSNLRNCNITGNVEASSRSQGFIEHCDGLNVNLNTAKSSRIILMWRCHNVKGNLVAGNMTYIPFCTYLNLNVSKGNLNLTDIEHSRFYSNGTNFSIVNINNCKFEINNSPDFAACKVNNCNFNMRNSVGIAVLNNLNNVNFVEGNANYKITNLDNCYNSWIYVSNIDGFVGNTYNTKLELKNKESYFHTWRVNNCEIAGFPYRTTYTTNCTFNVSLPVALFRNSNYVTWYNVWPHATPRGSSTLYHTNAGLRSVDNFSSCYLNCNDGSLVYASTAFSSANNMEMDIKAFYSSVNVSLPTYNMNIKLNIDCGTLNLGIFQAGPPHGFENSSISANNIYAKNTDAYYVTLQNGVRLYCEDFCDVPFYVLGHGSNEPVMLINNYKTSNSSCSFFKGGLTRVGRLNYQDGRKFRPYLRNGACLFINNALLSGADVDNSLLFVGSNVTWTNGVNVTNGGLIVNKANWGSHASKVWGFVSRDQLAWNVWDSGPWGSMTLFDYCINV